MHRMLFSTRWRRIWPWFPNLEEITVSGGTLPSFSLEKLPGIKSLAITGTNLESLDLSAAAGLERLVLDNNPSLTALDFTSNPKIKILSYSGTPLGWLDYSPLPELYYLDCSNSRVRDYLTISGGNASKYTNAGYFGK